MENNQQGIKGTGIGCLGAKRQITRVQEGIAEEANEAKLRKMREIDLADCRERGASGQVVEPLAKTWILGNAV